MTEQKSAGQAYIVVEKLTKDNNRRMPGGGKVVWKGSGEEFHRKERNVIMRRGLVYASLEDSDGNVVKILPLNVPRPPKQGIFKI